MRRPAPALAGALLAVLLAGCSTSQTFVAEGALARAAERALRRGLSTLYLADGSVRTAESVRFEGDSTVWSDPNGGARWAVAGRHGRPVQGDERGLLADDKKRPCYRGRALRDSP